MCFMFLMDTGLFISNVGQSLSLFQWAGDPITDNTPPLNDRVSAADVTYVWYYICSFLFEIVNVSSPKYLKPESNVQFIIGDAIVIWRAIVLWPHSYWVRGGFCFLFLGDVGMY